MPRRRSVKPKVSRSSPDTVSMPTVAKARPARSETAAFMGSPPPSPMKEQKARR